MKRIVAYLKSSRARIAMPLNRLHLYVKFQLRCWLGIELDRAAMEGLAVAIAANIEHVDGAFRAISEQLNQTTAGAMDTDMRLKFYEQHCETVRYAHERLKRAIAADEARKKLAAPALGDARGVKTS